MIKETNDIREVNLFLERAKKGQKTFRYFKNRPLEIIENQLVTLLGYDNQTTVSYGHLDKEDGVVWLGICTADSDTGKGHGKNMMEALICRASEMNLNKIRLSVDSSNAPAIKLYKKFRFKLLNIKENTCFYERIMHMDTIGSLFDKLATINLKMWNNQEILYEIRRMNFEKFKAKYFDTKDGAKKLWKCLKKACDLNIQRNQLIDEVDQQIVSLCKRVANGEDPDDGTFIQRKHKTY